MRSAFDDSASAGCDYFARGIAGMLPQPSSMEDADFSDDFCRFIQQNIPAVDAAELLLFLRANPQASWRGAEAAAKLRPATQITDADAVRYLETFLARGLVVADPDRRVQFRPANEELEMFVQMLALAYKERPVTLVRMIYALRDSRIQTFADAFRLKKN